jgi:hypothetical protein
MVDGFVEFVDELGNKIESKYHMIDATSIMIVPEEPIDPNVVRVTQTNIKGINESGGITKITTKYSTANKDTRIIVDSAFVKEHFLFLAPDKYDAEYRLAMNMMSSYTMSGKNRHDDVPDAMSMLADFVQAKVPVNKAIVMRRPF